MADSNSLLSRKEASKLLKISEQEIQSLTIEKRLKPIFKEKDNEKSEPFYRIREIEKLRKSLESSLDKRMKQDARNNGKVIVKKRAIDKSISQEEQSETRSTISAVEAAAKLILTIPEAAVLTHLSEAELRMELREGKLRGFIRGRGWKIRRADLDEFVRSIYVPKKL